jgi:hypothetical protein
MSDLALYQALLPLLETISEEIMTARDDVQALTAQLGKAKDEILAKLADLQAAIDNGTVTAADLDPLRTTVQSLDDITPDQPAEAPTENPPA